jgi:lactate permease
MNYFAVFLSVLPFIVFIFLLFKKKYSLLSVSVITLAIYLFLALFYWKIFPEFLLASFGKGFFIALDIFFIIFGAIFFLRILEDLKIIKNISYHLENFSRDYRVKTIIIAWIFSSFLEGTAGFGVPVAVGVPLLVGIGLSPIQSLVVGLLGNSTAGVFGAAGTPIRTGFAGLDIANVPLYASLLNFVGILIPIFMLWYITKNRVNRKREFLDALPFAVWSGLVLVLSSFLTVSLGQEFPSILGPAISFVIIILSVKFKIFTPKEHISLHQEKNEKLENEMSIFKAFLPYIILIVFLILGKFVLGNIGLPIDLGFDYVFKLFNPGFIFIISGIIIIFLWRARKSIWKDSLKESIRGVFQPFIVILAMSFMVQIMINSGNNFTGIESSVSLISDIFKTKFLVFFAPFVGAFGSFVTGSVTVSNIMFGNILNTASTALYLNNNLVLALSLVGAAIGNMIALADILTAEAILKEKNREISIIRGVILPCLVSLLIIGLLGMVLF